MSHFNSIFVRSHRDSQLFAAFVKAVIVPFPGHAVEAILLIFVMVLPRAALPLIHKARRRQITNITKI